MKEYIILSIRIESIIESIGDPIFFFEFLYLSCCFSIELADIANTLPFVFFPSPLPRFLDPSAILEQLKKGTNVDLSDAKILESIKSTSLDVSC